jgi:hypothetical protein
VDRLPSKLAAADPEAADVAAHHDVLARRQVMAQAQAEHRINPLDHPGARHGDAEAAVEGESPLCRHGNRSNIP